MACCGRKNPKKLEPYPVKKAVPPATKAAPKAIKPPQAPPGSVNPAGRFCAKCGWLVAITKYVDPITKQIVEKRTCTNRNCVDY